MSDTDTQSSEEWLGGYLRHLAHDFSAPVRHVVSFSELLQKHIADMEDEKLHKYTNFVHEGGLKMQAMLGAAQRLGRLQSLPITPREIPLGSLIEQIWASTIAPHYPNAKLELNARDTITMDAEHAQTLFSALLENACRYNPDGVTVTVTQEAGHITVQDSGAGFEEEMFDKACMLFTRLDPQAFPGGIGAGLAYAQAVLTRAHSRLIFKQTEHGAAFSFTL